MGRRAFDGQTLAGRQWSVAIERPAEGVYDAPQQSVAYRHIHDSACPRHLIACAEVLMPAQQYDADFLLVHVERDSKRTAGKLKKLLEAGTWEA